MVFFLCTYSFFFLLQITASDGSLSSNATLQVFITDQNDNPPIIQPSDILVVDSSTQTGTLVSQINGSDADVSTVNNHISYYLMRGGLDRFAVDEATGR